MAFCQQDFEEEKKNDSGNEPSLSEILWNTSKESSNSKNGDGNSKKSSCLNYLSNALKSFNNSFGPRSFSIDEKFNMLKLAFPDFDGGLIEDVLVTKDYDLMSAALVLSSFMDEMGNLLQEYQVVDKPTKEKRSNEDWVMIQNDWEVVDSAGDRIPSYSEVAAAAQRKQ